MRMSFDQVTAVHRWNSSGPLRLSQLNLETHNGNLIRDIRDTYFGEYLQDVYRNQIDGFVAYADEQVGLKLAEIEESAAQRAK